MKELKFNRNSWHGILWKSTWNKYFPDNICAYFWSLLLAIMISPLAIIGHLLNLFRLKITAAWWAIYPIVCFGLGAMLNSRDKLPFNWLHHSWWYMFIQGVGLSLIIIAVLFIILGCVIIKEKYDERQQEKNLNNPKWRKKVKIKQPNPLIEGFKSFKGKYCSKIIWQ